MPTYQLECPRCQWQGERHCHIAERNDQKCDCGGALKQVYAPPHVEIWKAEWWDMHGPNDRKFITSKKQLLKECEKRGCYSVGYG